MMDTAPRITHRALGAVPPASDHPAASTSASTAPSVTAPYPRGLAACDRSRLLVRRHRFAALALLADDARAAAQIARPAWSVGVASVAPLADMWPPAEVRAWTSLDYFEQLAAYIISPDVAPADIEAVIFDAVAYLAPHTAIAVDAYLNALRAAV